MIVSSFKTHSATFSSRGMQKIDRDLKDPFLFLPPFLFFAYNLKGKRNYVDPQLLAIATAKLFSLLALTYTVIFFKNWKRELSNIAAVEEMQVPLVLFRNL